MRTVGIIPARYGSTRFPGKPLASILGKPMIQRVYEQSSAASFLDEVIVATDDERILAAVREFGGKAAMTSGSARNGTERIAEVAQTLDAALVVNIQGDEPVIDPEAINELVRAMKDERVAPVGTLVKPVRDARVLTNPNIAKVVVDDGNYAIYFSRSAIPYLRDRGDMTDWVRYFPYYQHIGLYIYRREFLLEMVTWAPSKLEEAEQLEQLRVIEHGFKIKVAVTESDSISVDVPEDIFKVEQHLKGRTT
ncbi:MAG: 3-deoxy-manno-octulosonate cytidylyltransferase [Candidatus Zhuqueibacterota bacterium]